MNDETIPKELRNLRACLLCSMVKTLDQFEYYGCDNCEGVMPMKANREAVIELTSSNFNDLIAMMVPDQSWVARWQHIDKLCPGMYATSVTGQLPISVVKDLKHKGVLYESRDRSV